MDNQDIKKKRKKGHTPLPPTHTHTQNKGK